MNRIPTRLAGTALLEPRVFSDERGYFLESYNQRTLESVLGARIDFVQDNHSHSRHGVLRGMHYQLGAPQGKLVRVGRGTIWDAVIDLRRSSATFGQWEGFELSESNHRQLWVPVGFAHGYVVTSEHADVLYKTTDFWKPELERCIAWDDPELAIAWPERAPVLSAKDRQGTAFAEAEVYD
jgi:dTDP-4-dehydrorhamnose 3,5-epimerase